jgi:GTP-binding protein
MTMEEPTLTMVFRVNDGPFQGQDGKYLTGRQIGERLEKELRSNVALRVQTGVSGEEFLVSGRGLMHLGILIETMRREGYELCVGMPQVILKEVDGKKYEPIETLTVDCPIDTQSTVMSMVGERRAELIKMETKEGVTGYVHLEFSVPARGLIGLRTRLLQATQGEAIMYHSFREYQPLRGEVPKRQLGVIVSMSTGRATEYAMDALYSRGTFFIEPGQEIYEGQVLGEHCKESDCPVNVTKAKALNNMRAAGKEGLYNIRPKLEMSLEACLEYIQEDELVEITPASIRLRKRIRKENERKRAERSASKSIG